ncbi:hypothetical protein AOLI_G00148940 [Acnodon oligacanthus]
MRHQTYPDKKNTSTCLILLVVKATTPRTDRSGHGRPSWHLQKTDFTFGRSEVAETIFTESSQQDGEVDAGTFPTRLISLSLNVELHNTGTVEWKGVRGHVTPPYPFGSVGILAA